MAELTKQGLRSGSLNLLETIGQSVANIAPSGTPALTVAVVAGMAGTGSWVAFLIATIGMLFVGANVSVLASRHALAGSYFIYIGRILGPFAGMIAGFSMVSAYLTTGIASVISGQIFLTYVLNAMGLAAIDPPAWLFDTVFTALAWALAYRDIRMSSRVGMVIECASLAIIIGVTALVVIRHGSAFDRQQLDLPRLGWAGIMPALVLAVFSFVGFESAATLAKETRDPTRAIPRAIMLSAAVSGLFFTVITYAMMLGVDDETGALAGSPAPFAEITRRADLSVMATGVYAVTLVSTFACVLACLNAVSRLMFSMGRYAFIHGAMGAVHDRHQTPHLAIGAASAVTAGACIALSGLPVLDGFGLTATFSTFGFLVVYLLICVAAPMDLYRDGLLRAWHAAVGAVGVLLMVFTMFGSLYPVPGYPYDLLPYLFAGLLLAGASWYSILAARAPSLLEALRHDME